MLDFSESEQLEYYQERYRKSTVRQNRRGNLIARQLEALSSLEQLVGLLPRVDDPLDNWLHPDLAVRLNDAGLRPCANWLHASMGSVFGGVQGFKPSARGFPVEDVVCRAGRCRRP